MATVPDECRDAGEVLGQITDIGGSRMQVTDLGGTGQGSTRIGALVKVRSHGEVVGIVDAMSFDNASPPRRTLCVNLLGEIARAADRSFFFRRGVAHSPALGATVRAATKADLAMVYARPSVASINVGTLSNDDQQPAFVMLDDLLARHFAIVGSTGCGKSCAVALILNEILANNASAHVVLLDPHNEYASAFAERAEVVSIENGHLPFWLLDFEEATNILVRGGTQQEQESQAMILKDALRMARQDYADPAESRSWITVDTPVPFLIHELRRHLRESVGLASKPEAAGPHLRLLSRLESLIEDRRYSFMFGNSFDVTDTLSELVGRLLRIPVAGKPITILDLSGVPSEIADVMVSVTCRILFDFTLWSDPRRRPPILLACEEAHRYLPSNEGTGFAACTRTISRIAREGRKYGLSLALISQRPSELSSQALSQCGTIFALRLGNELDKRFVEQALPETSHSMLGSLSSLPVQQAIVFGEGVPLPMRVTFKTIAPDRRPQSQSARFGEAWQCDSAGIEFRDQGVRRWRTQYRETRLD